MYTTGCSYFLTLLRIVLWISPGSSTDLWSNLAKLLLSLHEAFLMIALRLVPSAFAVEAEAPLVLWPTYLLVSIPASSIELGVHLARVPLEMGAWGPMYEIKNWLCFLLTHAVLAT